MKHSKTAWDIDLIYWVNDMCIIYGDGVAASAWCGFHEVLGIAKNPARGSCALGVCALGSFPSRLLPIAT